MKKLQDSMAKFDEKYVKVEALSDADKMSTYGGARVLKYGLPPMLKYGVPGAITVKYGVPIIEAKYGVPDIPTPLYGIPYPSDTATE